MSYAFYRHHQSRSLSSTLATVAISCTCVVTTYLLTKNIYQYGLSGTIRLIWEGDHLPPHIREALETLDDLENRRIPRQARKLDKIDCMIQVAKLNSVDHDHEIAGATIDNVPNQSKTEGDDNESTPLEIKEEKPMDDNKKHYILSQTPQLTKELSMLSHTLDKLVAEIDFIASHGNVDVKRRKKALSALLVQMMERADEFIVECGIVLSST